MNLVFGLCFRFLDNVAQCHWLRSIRILLYVCISSYCYWFLLLILGVDGVDLCTKPTCDVRIPI